MNAAYDKSMPRSQKFQGTTRVGRHVNRASQGSREPPRDCANRGHGIRLQAQLDRVAKSLVLVASVALAGCATPASSPRQTLQAMLLATRLADPAPALYALLPMSARRSESLAAFRVRVTGDRTSLDELSGLVSAALSAATPITAELHHGARWVPTIEERDGWRLGGAPLGEGGVVTTPGQDGVRAAIEHLRRTLVRGDLQGLLSMLSARARGAMESDLRDLAAALEDPEALQFPDVPGATRVRLPDGRQLLLIWEHDGWHVEGLREGATP